MIFMLAPFCLVLQILEAWQVELAAKIKLIGHNSTRVLAKLVEGFNGTRAVLVTQVRRYHEFARFWRAVPIRIHIIWGCSAARTIATHTQPSLGFFWSLSDRGGLRWGVNVGGLSLFGQDLHWCILFHWFGVLQMVLHSRRFSRWLHIHSVMIQFNLWRYHPKKLDYKTIQQSIF